MSHAPEISESGGLKEELKNDEEVGNEVEELSCKEDVGFE